MKKIKIAFFAATLLLASWECKKSSDTPTVGFTASALDSVKARAYIKRTFDSASVANAGFNVDSIITSGIDSIIIIHSDSFFVFVPPNTPSSIYKNTLYFRYTGGADFSVIYTGDSLHIYNPQSYNPLTDSVTSIGYSFSNSIVAHPYTNAGTYTATVVATNVKNKGKDINRATLPQTYIIK